MANIYLGMADEELEKLASNVDVSSGLAPWIYWPSEIYGIGKCFRYMSKYPKYLPLYIYSDHGAGLETKFFPHEINNSANVYFTWRKQKYERYKSFTEKKVLRIIHPWIFYRRSKGIKRNINSKGTIVFFTHSCPGQQWINHATFEYFKSLNNLPDKYKPIVICLHMHDINEGYHKKLRKYGFPIITMGNTSSQNFVDRFYNTVKYFSYATSQTWGSHVAYCVEMGIPFYFLGNIPDLINLSSDQRELGVVEEYYDHIHKENLKKAYILFNAPSDYVSLEQSEFVQQILGLDIKFNRLKLSLILWVEFLKNIDDWPRLLKPIYFKYKKYKFNKFVKKIYLYIKRNN